MSYYWAYQAAGDQQWGGGGPGGGPPGGGGGGYGGGCPAGTEWNDITKKCVPKGPPGGGGGGGCSVPPNHRRYPGDGCPPGYLNKSGCCRPGGGCRRDEHFDYRKKKCVPNNCLPWEHWDDNEHKCRGPYPPKCSWPYTWDWPKNRCAPPSRWPKYKPVTHVVNEDIDINVDITGADTGEAAPAPAPAGMDLSSLLSGDCAGLPIPCALLVVGGLGALMVVMMMMKK